MNHPAVHIAKLFARLNNDAVPQLPTCCHPRERRDDAGVIHLVECPCALTREEVVVNARQRSLDPHATLTHLKTTPQPPG
jgi:hypothetical protein